MILHSSLEMGSMIVSSYLIFDSSYRVPKALRITDTSFDEQIFGGLLAGGLVTR